MSDVWVTRKGEGIQKRASMPLVTVLNYSGGTQSAGLLWMVLNGDLDVPERFIVVNADPGMENSGTYEYNRMIQPECEKAGIPYFEAPGPSLYEDILAFAESGRGRIDNPPFWIKKFDGGKRGRLKQKCTKHYKIAPMDRVIRRYLEEHFGISRKSKRLGKAIVEKWIGFSADEVDRISEPSQFYVAFRFPLVEKGMAKGDVRRYMEDRGLPVPPRSVCNACFANDADLFREMYHERPQDWAQAVAVDEAVRDGRPFGVTDGECYVFQGCIPLTELAERGFRWGAADQRDYQCNNGHCFL